MWSQSVFVGILIKINKNFHFISIIEIRFQAID